MVDTGVLKRPHLLLNADETYIPINVDPSKLVTDNGARSCWKIGSGERSFFSCKATANSEGLMAPPMLLFAGMYAELSKLSMVIYILVNEFAYDINLLF